MTNKTKPASQPAAKSDDQAVAKSANRPVAKLRSGLITANVWPRVTDNGVFHSVTFERGFKTKDGQWKSTTSFDRDDLLVIAKLATEAHTVIDRLRSDTE